MSMVTAKAEAVRLAWLAAHGSGSVPTYLRPYVPTHLRPYAPTFQRHVWSHPCRSCPDVLMLFQ